MRDRSGGMRVINSWLTASRGNIAGRMPGAEVLAVRGVCAGGNVEREGQSEGREGKAAGDSEAY